MDSINDRRVRIPEEMKKRCLESFREGNGYKKTATLTGIKRYTVRDYLRRYKAGDCSWAGVSGKEGGDE